jgi:hypothetical protein
MEDSMIHNVHQRELPAPPSQVGALLDRLAGPDDPLWPRGWPPVRLDRPLGVGADGGHGPVRYRAVQYQPGQRVLFEFHSPTRLRGTHCFEVTSGRRPGSSVLRHTLSGRPVGWSGRLSWALAYRWLHDVVLEELLDRASVAVGHPPSTPTRRSAWVLLLRKVVGAARIRR